MLIESQWRRICIIQMRNRAIRMPQKTVAKRWKKVNIPMTRKVPGRMKTWTWTQMSQNVWRMLTLPNSRKSSKKRRRMQTGTARSEMEKDWKRKCNKKIQEHLTKIKQVNKMKSNCRNPWCLPEKTLQWPITR